MPVIGSKKLRFASEGVEGRKRKDADDTGEL